MERQLLQPETNLFAKVVVKQNIDVSIVIPIYNEEESLGHLYAKLHPLLDSWEHNFEVVLVDDGSSDNSPNILRKLQQEDERIQVVLLRRNFGQTAAFSAGFDHARGRILITMDGDLQNDPADIPKRWTRWMRATIL